MAGPFGGLQGGQEALLVVVVATRLQDSKEPLGCHNINIKPVSHSLVDREGDISGFGLIMELVMTETRAGIQLRL